MIQTPFDVVVMSMVVIMGVEPHNIIDAEFVETVGIMPAYEPTRPLQIPVYL